MMSSEVKGKEPWSILKTIMALLLIGLCLWAAQWQYHRGIDRHSRNSIIEARIAKSPLELTKVENNLSNYEWQTVSASGVFDSKKQILLRNRYNEGKYGYEVLTLFTSDDSRQFWVDRGWVEAGATATTAPIVTPVPESRVRIIGRLRLDSSLPADLFLRYPAKDKVWSPNSMLNRN
jgi:surfeit locus 1 family protein